MNKSRVVLAISIVAFAMSAAAQVTGSGTTGTVPVFTGSSALGNSAITQSGGDVGIGMATPTSPLVVNGSNTATSSAGQIRFLNTSYTTLQAGLGVEGGTGSIIDGTATGDLSIWSNGAKINLSANNGNTDQLVLLANGNIGIGMTTPAVTLDILGNFHVGGNSSPNTVEEGAYVAWNQLGTGTGETDFINNQGLGFGGFGFFNTSPASGGLGTSLMYINSAGRVGIGTLHPQYALDVTGTIRTSTGVIFPDNTTQTTAFTGVICGGDYAESVDVTGSRTNYEPGDLLVIDPRAPGKFLKSAEAYSTLVAGIYSTKPGTVGRRQSTPKSPDEVPMAMIGIVPTNVSAENGSIKTGDLLVTSSTMGYAMKGTDRERLTGAVIGKALGSLDSGKGVIEVLVTLQ